MFPKVLKGNCHDDSRGTLLYNNNFDATAVRRMYVIESISTDFVRAWQGHKIEQRWFSVISGAIKIELILIDNWDSPSINLKKNKFVLQSDSIDVLHVPAGYVISIQSLVEGAKLLVMSNHLLGEINDEYRYSLDYFEYNKK